MDSFINIGIFITYLFAFSAIASILFFALRSLLGNFKEAVISLVGVGILILVFIVSFLISGSGDISQEFFDKTETNPAYSKIIGSGLIMLYFMIASVVVVIIYAQFAKLFKK